MPKNHKAETIQQPKTSDIKPPKTKLKANKKLRKNVVIALAWIIALFAVGVISFSVSRNNALAADKKAETALDALKANDDTRLYNLGTEELKKASDKTKVKTVVNEWHTVITQATNGDPELVSKQTTTTKDGNELVALIYKYQVQPGKSKINQKELFVKIDVIKTSEGYKINAFNIDVQKKLSVN